MQFFLEAMWKKEFSIKVGIGNDVTTPPVWIVLAENEEEKDQWPENA